MILHHSSLSKRWKWTSIFEGVLRASRASREGLSSVIASDFVLFDFKAVGDMHMKAFRHLVLCREGGLVLKVLKTCVCGKFADVAYDCLKALFLYETLGLLVRALQFSIGVSAYSLVLDIR